MITFNDMDEIDENLWLGNIYAAENITELKNKGIKKILTVMNGFKPKIPLKEEFIHKQFEIKDLSNQNIIQYFGDCLNFIKGDEKVLVHCQAGASRSASIVIAYLMWKKRKKYDEILKLVKSKRFIVSPNFGFKEQLIAFEKVLADNDYDIDKIKFNEIKVILPL